ncbi:MAG: hypothetical protein ACEQR8_01860 [Cypionkella sp.]
MDSVLHSLARSRAFRSVRCCSTAAVRRADRALRRRSTWSIAVLAVAALQTLLIALHQPWLDEVQAAMIALEAPDLATLLRWLAYEGHPPAWYLLLRALGYLVEPLWTLKLAALLCAAAAQAAILFAAPFSRAERLLLATSQFVLFEYLTISRSLSLGAAAMIVAVALWRRRSGWLAIALLPMCDFLFGVISLAFVALKVRERALWWPGLILWGASGLAAAWSVRPAPDVVPAEAARELIPDAFHWLMAMGTLLVPWQGPLLPQWNEPPFILLAPFGALLFLAFAWRTTAHDRGHRAIVFGLTALTAVVGLFVYRLFARHLMLIALTLILLVWRDRAQGRPADPAFRLWLLAGSLCGLATAAMSLVWPFDRSAEAGEWVVANGLADKHWVTYPMHRSPAVTAASGIEFERTEQRCRQSFVRWDMRTRLETVGEFTAYFRREARLHGRGYLLSEKDLRGVPADVLRPLGAIPRGYGGPPAYFYEIGPGTPERRIEVPPCVPHRRPFAKLP